jgi:hypothetical protein
MTEKQPYGKLDVAVNICMIFVGFMVLFNVGMDLWGPSWVKRNIDIWDYVIMIPFAPWFMLIGIRGLIRKRAF